MTPAEAFAFCERTVRSVDADRHLTTLFAPAETRPLLFALYAFNHELARAGEMSRDVLAAEIRLQWWRDALGAAREGRPPAHPVAFGVAEMLSRDQAQAPELEALIDARAIEGSPAPFPTLAAMVSHARATSARLMRIAARMIVGTGALPEVIDEAGIAYGLAGMTRSFRFHALRGRIFLPADLLATESLSMADVMPGKDPAKLRRILGQVTRCALDHCRRARQVSVPSAVLPAVLTASLVPAYLAHVAQNPDPWRETDLSRLRKQLIVLRAALLRRL